MSVSLKKVLQIIKKNESRLKTEFQVASLFLFGSIVRGDYKKGSDIDVLVDFSTSEVGLFEVVRLQQFLSNELKREVDLVTQGAVLDWMRESIEKECVRAA